MGVEAGEKTASECRDAFFVKADVSDPKSVQAMYAETEKRYSRVDILYNNAGIMPPDDDSILITEPEAWDRVQAVNAKGVYLCCKYGIPYLLKAGGGSVINVASFVALMGAATSQIAYTASKGAVLSMSRELAVQFARQGVRVNALCPGPVETPLLMRIFNADPGAYERRRAHLPMGRLRDARVTCPRISRRQNAQGNSVPRRDNGRRMRKFDRDDISVSGPAGIRRDDCRGHQLKAWPDPGRRKRAHALPL